MVCKVHSNSRPSELQENNNNNNNTDCKLTDPAHVNRIVHFAGLQHEFIAEPTHRRRTAGQVPAANSDFARRDVSIK